MSICHGHQTVQTSLRAPPLPSNVILNLSTKTTTVPTKSTATPVEDKENLREEDINKNESPERSPMKLRKNTYVDQKAFYNSNVKTIDDNNNVFTSPTEPTVLVRKNDFSMFDSSIERHNLPLIISNDGAVEIDQTMKILIVGNAKCGKSSIIARYAMNSFHENYKTTIGADFVRKDLALKMNDGEILGVRLQLWDIAGQDRFQKMTRAYFAKARGVVIVCDVSREGTVEAIKNWKSEINHWSENIPVILLANKADLLTNAQEAFKTGATMERICREQGILHWWSTSARTGEYVDEGFALLIAHVLEAERKKKEAENEISRKVEGQHELGFKIASLSRPHLRTNNSWAVSQSVCW